MTRQKLTISLVTAAFAVSIAPALAAQDTRGGQAGSRPSNGQTTGSAEPRGGSSGGSSGTSSSSAGSGSGSSSGMGSSSGSSGSSMGSSGYSSGRERAPERPSASERRSGGDRGEAVSRGSSPSGNNPRGAGSNATTSSTYGDGQGRDRSPVPAYSRPRDGRTAIGGAGVRVGPIPGRDGSMPGRGSGSYYPLYDPYYYYGYYDPYSMGYGYRYSRYWMPGYGYGLGYFGFDPFLFGGYYDPYDSGYGQGYPSGGGSGYGAGRYHDAGSLRLKVKPANAQVYIDGYYVGVIDSFDGAFQRLEIESGSHRVEVRAEGFAPVQFDVMVTPGETITYKGELQRIR